MDRVRRIADTVLYEGHVLWPYRRSSIKNRQRWTFGGIYPAAYATTTSDRARVRVDCLVEGEAPCVDVEVRFLHVLRRQLVVDGREVDELERDGQRLESWDEATERVVGPGRFAIAGGCVEEPPFRRSWQPLEGRVEVHVEPLAHGLRRLELELVNTSDFAGTSRDDALRRTFVSAHAVLRVEGGAFVSAVDPPPEHAAAAAACRTEGLWPFLAGEPGDRTTMLASPIILYDHPEVAPESPGDFFDGCEIDQLLVLSILGLSEDEKREVRAGDPRAREILELTEAMSRDDLMRLHGTFRG